MRLNPSGIPRLQLFVASFTMGRTRLRYSGNWQSFGNKAVIFNPATLPSGKRQHFGKAARLQFGRGLNGSNFSGQDSGVSVRVRDSEAAMRQGGHSCCEAATLGLPNPWWCSKGECPPSWFNVHLLHFLSDDSDGMRQASPSKSVGFDRLRYLATLQVGGSKALPWQCSSGKAWLP